MPSVDRGVQREVKKMWKPNFQQTILNCSRAAHAHTRFHAQSLVPGVSGWMGSHDLGPEPEVWSPRNFGAFFFLESGSRSGKKSCNWPTHGMEQCLGLGHEATVSFWVLQVQVWVQVVWGVLWTGDVAGDVARLAFHNVTPRQRNSHKPNFPIFGKGL